MASYHGLDKYVNLLIKAGAKVNVQNKVNMQHETKTFQNVLAKGTHISVWIAQKYIIEIMVQEQNLYFYMHVLCLQ